MEKELTSENGRGRIGWVRPLAMSSHGVSGASQQSHLCVVDEMILN